jgi:LuxR family maltose regulon positive regulatory protein
MDTRTLASTGLIDRRRLFDTLDQAVEKRLTLISAPAGSGKTSLLRTWIDRLEDGRRVVFVSARSAEDEQSFWLILLAALESPEIAPAPTFSGSGMVERVLTQLDENHDPVVIAIDDVDELAHDTLLHIAKLIEELPAHAHVVLVSRRDLRLGIHRLRLAGQVAEIRATQLEFSESETREFLASSRVTLSNDSVRTLQQRMEGWAAGLRLAALSLAVDPDPEAFVAQFSGSNRVVADYLIAEMLERQPEHVQRLLLTTSILERVNGELADLLSGTSGSDKILLGLEDANAFVVSLDGERKWFRYHHLFRELLRLELRRTMPDRISELHRRAAEWFADRGYPIEAIRQAQAHGDWQNAAWTLTDQLFDLLIRGHNETIASLLNAFPRAARLNHPELALVDAALEMQGGLFEDATEHLDVAERELRNLPAKLQEGYSVGIAILRLGLARRQGHLEGVIERVNDLGTSGVLRAMALMNLGIVEMWSGRLADADRHLRDAAKLSTEINVPYLQVICLSSLGFASKIHSFAEAHEQSERAFELAQRYGWESEPIVVPALLTLAGTPLWAGDFKTAEKWLERAIEAMRPGTNPPEELLLHIVIGMLHVGRNRLKDALVEFAEAERMQSRMLGQHVLAAQATAWAISLKARLGLLDDARVSLAALPPQMAESAEIRNAAAMISLESGAPEDALVDLRDVLEGNLPLIHDFVLIESQLLGARAYLTLHDDTAATMLIEKALALAERERLLWPFAMTGVREALRKVPHHMTAHAALLLEIVDVLDGLSPRLADFQMPGGSELSPTEVRVLRFLPTNLSRSDIARELYVSVNTVNTHVRNIYSKLGAASRTEAVERARQLRLLAH